MMRLSSNIDCNWCKLATFPLLSVCGRSLSVHATLRDLCVLTAITAPLLTASPFIPDALRLLSQYMAPKGEKEKERHGADLPKHQTTQEF